MMSKVTNGRNLKFSTSTVPARRYVEDNGLSRLRTYLGRVRKGNPNVYKTPFAKNESTEELLNAWDKHLVSIADEWPSLYAFEAELRSKVGPMSVQKPLDERMDDIYHYYEGIHLPSEPINPAAIDAVVKEFEPVKGLRIRSQKNTVEKMKKSSNSGVPFFTTRRNVTLETVPARTEWTGNSVFMNQAGFKTLGAAVIGWRGQEGGADVDDVKQRVVWMFPYAVNIDELCVYQPLIEACQKTHLVPAWESLDRVDEEITHLFDTKGDNDLIVCSDFSKFDQHFNPRLQNGGAEILARLLTADARRWLEEVYPIKYNIPLIIESFRPEELTILSGPHGMASGSGGTNADETLVHRALQVEVALNNGATLNKHSMCLGDDGILSYPGISVESVTEAYRSHGLVCNPEKQYASLQECVFLRRWHHKDYRVSNTCVGVYSTFRALGRLRYLERFMDPAVWSPTMVALRQLSIIENVKWHPLFHEFIDFCMTRDKYRLGIDIPGFLDELPQLAQEANDYMPDFMGYTKTLSGEGVNGISQWEVVKYLKSQA